MDSPVITSFSELYLYRHPESIVPPSVFFFGGLGVGGTFGTLRLGDLWMVFCSFCVFVVESSANSPGKSVSLLGVPSRSGERMD